MNKNKEPEYRAVSELAKGKSPEIIKIVNDEDRPVILTKQGKPTSVIISYERYTKLKYTDNADI